jgi:hypothetical protein
MFIWERDGVAGLHACPNSRSPRKTEGPRRRACECWALLTPEAYQLRFVKPLCLSKNLNPDVLMMEPAEDRYRSDATDLLLPPGLRSIFIQ